MLLLFPNTNLSTGKPFTTLTFHTGRCHTPRLPPMFPTAMFSQCTPQPQPRQLQPHTTQRQQPQLHTRLQLLQQPIRQPQPPPPQQHTPPQQQQHIIPQLPPNLPGTNQ